jgi:hypothetical protein
VFQPSPNPPGPSLLKRFRRTCPEYVAVGTNKHGFDSVPREPGFQLIAKGLQSGIVEADCSDALIFR